MKKILILTVVCVISLSLAACTVRAPQNSTSEVSSEKIVPSDEREILNTDIAEADVKIGNDTNIASSTNENALILYFTRSNNLDREPDIDAISRASINVVKDGIYGNTEIIARFIQDSVDGDLLPLEVSSPYPYLVDDTIEGINNNGDSRIVTTQIENLDQYGIIYIGYPIWYATLPEPISRFIEAQDFSGKIIVPFSTHRGSRMGSSIRDLGTLLPNSTIVEGFTISGESAIESEVEVEEWLKKIGMISP